MLLSFAAGALITALTFELFEDAYQRGGIVRAALGLLAKSAHKAHKVGAAAHDVAWPPAPTGSTNTQIRYLFIRGS
jgi:hypothetical protein